MKLILGQTTDEIETSQSNFKSLKILTLFIFQSSLSLFLFLQEWTL